MKKILVLLMVLAMVMAVFSGCTPKEEPEVAEAPDSLQVIMDKGEFVLGLDDSFPPMGFRDDKGEIVGFDIVLAKEVASRMGIVVVLKPVVLYSTSP